MSKIRYHHNGAALKHNSRVGERSVLAAAGACGGKLEPGNERLVLLGLGIIGLALGI